MRSVASRELRNHTRSLLERVEAGEEITITVSGRPVARLSPPEQRQRWTRRATFIASLTGAQADPDLRHELRRLAPDSTDDLPL